MGSTSSRVDGKSYDTYDGTMNMNGDMFVWEDFYVRRNITTDGGVKIGLFGKSAETRYGVQTPPVPTGSSLSFVVSVLNRVTLILRRHGISRP